MPNYAEEVKVVDVAPGTGVHGVVRAVEAILKLGKVQELTVTPGKVTYVRLRKEDEPEQLIELDLSTLMPAHVVRNCQLEELSLKSVNAAVVIGQMFFSVALAGMNPVAFVGGTNSELWAWYEATTQLAASREEFYGVPFYADKDIPDEVLVLCSALGRRAAMVDVTHGYKITIPAKRRKT